MITVDFGRRERLRDLVQAAANGGNAGGTELNGEALFALILEAAVVPLVQAPFLIHRHVAQIHH